MEMTMKQQQLPRVETKFEIIQRENAAWARANFDVRDPMLGVVEEVGELHEALEADGPVTPILEALIRDAVGDTLIYMANLCDDLGMSMSLVHDAAQAELQRGGDSPGEGFLVWLGRLAHHKGKLAQGVRGTPEFHRAKIFECMTALLVMLDEVLYREADTLEQVAWDTWQVVKTRDWNAERANQLGPWATHECCDPCWKARHGERVPHRVNGPQAQRLTCCYCGAENSSGIYVREAKSNVPCCKDEGHGE